MEKTDYLNIDFKALEVLKLVYDLSSISAAAVKLGQNQSSVSYTVDRLRAAFGDPLFVRAGRGIVPTVRCVEIIIGVEALLDGMAALVSPLDFDPATYEATISISCNHFEHAVFLPQLIRRIQTDAPNIKLNIIQSMVQGHNQLKKGQCDILLSPVHAEFENLYRQKLITDKYVCVVDENNSSVGGRMTFAHYSKCNHVAVIYEGDWRPLYLDAVEARGVALNITVGLPSSGDLLRVIKGTDLVLTVPQVLANSFQGRYRTLPTPFEAKVEIFQFWNTRTHHSLPHQWIRSVIAEIANEIGQEQGP